MDTDGHSIYNMDNQIINYKKPIYIGNHVWLGCNTTLLKGAQIDNNVIIGTNTILSKHIEGSSIIVAGNPCRVIKQIVNWLR